MNKFRYATVSLIGAIPAAAMCYFLFVAVTGNPLDNMTTNVKILTFFTMTVGAFVIVLPAGILIFGPKTENSEETDKQSSATEEDDVEENASESDEESADDSSLDDGSNAEEPAAESEDDLKMEESADIYESDDTE